MDSSTASAPRAGRGVRWLVLVALAALASWPFVETLGYWPMTADPPTWISRGTPLSEDWLSWVFAKDHYSWYRPVSALSFALTQMVADVNPWAYRVGDLALHLAVGLLAGAVFTRWFAKASPWAGVLVVALVWMHPIAEEVVPYMARRSYSLAAVFGLAGLLSLHGAVERARSGASSLGASLCTGALLVLALFSNEAAISTVVAVPLFVAAALRGRAGAWREGLSVLVPAGAVVVVAMVVRVAILGGLGGYEDPGQAEAQIDGILVPLAHGLVGSEGLFERFGTAALVPLIGLAIFYLVTALRGATASAGQEQRLVLASLLWLAGAAVLFLAMGIYSARQVYGLQVPFALLTVGTVLGGGRRGPAWVALVLCAALMLQASPVLRGQAPNRLAGWAERQALLSAMHDDLGACREPALVRLVLPNMRPAAPIRPDGTGGERVRLHRSIRQPSTWTEIALHARELELRDYVYYPRDGAPVRLDATARTIALPGGAENWQRRGQSFVPASGVLDLAGLSWPEDKHGYVYVFADGVGQLISVSSPAAGRGRDD